MDENKKIKCHNCVHFFITWESDHPYGCNAMNFKGKQIPSAIVLRTSGKRCMLYKEKNKNTFGKSFNKSCDES
ncbi:MAG: uracil-DNA glycosylase [Desulfobacteraceae bacterium]|nr:uracil-DNA glycosylase [Desulfobacteraceae bacterium]